MADVKEKRMICLSPDVCKLLEQASKEDHRSFSNMIEHIILKYFGK